MARVRSVSEDSAYQVFCARSSSAACSAAAPVELFLLLAGGGQVSLEGAAAGADRGLVGLLALQLVAQRGVVVGEQPQPGVAQVGLDDVRPAGRPRPAGRAA